MYIIENDLLSQEQRDALNAALKPLTEKLEAMEAKKAKIVAELDSMDSEFALGVKGVFEKAAEHLEEAGLSEEFGETIEEELRDLSYDVLYDWCSGRPLDYNLSGDGDVEFWEPSSC